MGAQLENLVAAGGGLVEGTVQRVTYRSDDNGYSVLQVASHPPRRLSCWHDCCFPYACSWRLSPLSYW